MEKVWYKLWASVRGDMGWNTMFGEHMKDKQMC